MSSSSSSSSSSSNLPITSPYGFGQPPTNHLLHPSYSNKVLQTWSSEHATTIPKASLVWPLFIVENVCVETSKKNQKSKIFSVSH